MYGVGYLQNLSTLAEHSQQVSVLVHDRILQPFWDAIRIGGLAVWFDCRAYMDMPIVFWREGLKHVCHDLLGIGLISEDPIRDQLMMRCACPDTCLCAAVMQQAPPVTLM